jgi:hypothetical protein
MHTIRQLIQKDIKRNWLVTGVENSVRNAMLNGHVGDVFSSIDVLNVWMRLLVELELKVLYEGLTIRRGISL